MATLPPIGTLAELLVARARTHPGHPCVDDGATVLDHTELLARSRGCAARLAEHGVGPGDRVLLVGRNSVDWVVVAFGCLLLGASVVPIGHGGTLDERSRATDLLQPRAVVLEEGIQHTGNRIPVLDLGDLARTGADVATVPLAGPTPDNEAFVLSTSGTTGAVKHVAMTHRQLTRLYGEVSASIGLRSDDRVLGAVPLAHSFGLNGVLLVSLFAGALVRLLPAYDRDQLAAVVRDDGLTVVAGPPTILHDLAAAHAPAELAVRLVITGSTEVHADRVRAVCDRLGVPEIVVGYGMTESCGTVAIGRLPAVVDTPAVGLDVVPGVEVRVADGSGAPAAPDLPGHLSVRGFNVLAAYAGSDTSATDADGWFETGDVARVGADGRLTLVSRHKDTVIVSGFNVAPEEVEWVLLEHPQVAQVAVVGVADERQGERLVACVVPAPGEPVDQEVLVAHARERLPGYKVPHTYVTLDELPTTATGKVSRAAVRRLATEAAPGS